MFTTDIMLATGRKLCIKTELHPSLEVNPDGSIFNTDVDGKEWKVQWWQVTDIQVSTTATP